MHQSRTDFEDRLDATAHLLVKGSTGDDYPEWSTSFATRVREAAERAAKRVDWALEGMTPPAGLAWTFTTLTALVDAHLNHARAVISSGRGVVTVSVVADQAAKEWEKHTVGWVPDPVSELINAALAEQADRESAMRQARDIRNARIAERTARAKAEIARQKQVEYQREQEELARVAAEKAEERARQKQRDDQHKQEERARVAAQRRELKELARVKAEAEALAHAANEAKRQERWRNRPAPAPPPQPFGVSHEGAESLCAAWMRHLGVLDAEVTKYVGDGGIDVESEQYVAQVKNYTGSVAVADVRALFGVAVADGRHPILFTSGTITSEGRAFAARIRMALIHYDALDGTLRGLNALGDACIERSIPEAFAAARVL